MKFYLIVLAALTFLAHAEEQKDNRIKPGFNVGDTIPDEVKEVFLSEPDLRKKIASFRNDDLIHSVELNSELKWQRRVALRDADYILCLFDSTIRAEPGNNPRTLILFTPDYNLQTWGHFTCDPFFACGCIVSPIHQPNTYFVIVNQSGRFGGSLWFEKYLIASDSIRKLGEGPEVTRIPK